MNMAIIATPTTIAALHDDILAKRFVILVPPNLMILLSSYYDLYPNSRHLNQPKGDLDRQIREARRDRQQPDYAYVNSPPRASYCLNRPKGEMVDIDLSLAMRKRRHGMSSDSYPQQV
jgi:hypothetical protein